MKKTRPNSKNRPPTGTAKPDRLARLAETLWLPDGIGAAEKAARLAAASGLLDDINPAKGAETMLAIQMVATHEASTECLRRSMAGGPSPEGRDEYLKHAEKLLALYARQMEVLGRHRLRELKLAEHRAKEANKKPRITKIKRSFVGPDGVEYPEDEYFSIVTAARKMMAEAGVSNEPRRAPKKTPENTPENAPANTQDTGGGAPDRAAGGAAISAMPAFAGFDEKADLP